MWFNHYVQHPLGVTPPPNLDRVVSTIGLTSVTAGDMLVLDTTAASNLDFSASSANSIFGRVMQATALEAECGICCVALETYTGSAQTQIRARFAGIVTAKIHRLAAVDGGAVPVRGQLLVMNLGGGTPGRSFTRVAPTATYDAGVAARLMRSRKCMLLQPTTMAENASALHTVLLNGFA